MYHTLSVCIETSSILTPISAIYINSFCKSETEIECELVLVLWPLEPVIKLKESKRELLGFAAHWIYWILGYALQTSRISDLVLTFPSSDRYD